MKTPETGEMPMVGGKIFLLEDREKLEAKLQEYNGRLQPYQAPEIQFDTICKIAISKALVETGEADLLEIQQELKNKYGNSFDNEAFSNAWAVIKDYVETGGKHVVRSTGF